MDFKQCKKKKQKKKRRKPLTKKKLKLIEYEVKELIEDLYEKVGKLIEKEEEDSAEPLTIPSVFD